MSIFNQIKQALSFGLMLVSTQVLSGTIGEISHPIWQGPYIGGFIGGAFGRYQVNTTTGAPSSTTYFTSQDNINSVNQQGSRTLNPQSFIGGIQAGDDWMWNTLVLGVMVDYGSFQQDSNIDASNIAYPDGSGHYTVTSSVTTDWLFTFRGRIGKQFNTQWPSLLYFTGGMAITNLNVSNAFSDDTLLLGIGSSSISGNQIGWTLGTGIECIVTEHLSANAEYLYLNMPSLTTNGTISNSVEGFGIASGQFTSPFSTKAALSSNLIRFGVHYRFNA